MVEVVEDGSERENVESVEEYEREEGMRSGVGRGSGGVVRNGEWSGTGVSFVASVVFVVH